MVFYAAVSRFFWITDGTASKFCRLYSVDWLLFSLSAWVSLPLPRTRVTEKTDSFSLTEDADMDGFRLAKSISMMAKAVIAE